MVHESPQRDDRRAFLAAAIDAWPGEAVDDENAAVPRANDRKPRVEVAPEDPVLCRRVGLERPDCGANHGFLEERRDRLTWTVGHLAPLLTVERAPTGLRRRTTPLLEEERNAGVCALIANRTHPLRPDRPMSWAALTP